MNQNYTYLTFSIIVSLTYYLHFKIVTFPQIQLNSGHIGGPAQSFILIIYYPISLLLIMLFIYAIWKPVQWYLKHLGYTKIKAIFLPISISFFILVIFQVIKSYFKPTFSLPFTEYLINASKALWILTIFWSLFIIFIYKQISNNK